MKKAIFLFFIALFACNSIKAQCDSTQSQTLFLTLGAENLCSLRNKGLTMHGYDFNMGFKLNRIELFGTYEAMSHHQRNDSQKLYHNSNSLAVGVGYDLSQSKDHLSFVPLRIKVGWTVGKPDWKYNFYDISIHRIRGVHSNIPAINLGVGYRYVNSRTRQMTNHSFVYFSFGFQL